MTQIIWLILMTQWFCWPCKILPPAVQRLNCVLVLGGTLSGGWYEESEVNRDEKCETTLTKTIQDFLQGYFSHFYLTWLKFNVLKYVLLPKTYKQRILMMWSLFDKF